MAMQHEQAPGFDASSPHRGASPPPDGAQQGPARPSPHAPAMQAAAPQGVAPSEGGTRRRQAARERRRRRRQEEAGRGTGHAAAATPVTTTWAPPQRRAEGAWAPTQQRQHGSTDRGSRRRCPICRSPFEAGTLSVNVRLRDVIATTAVGSSVDETMLECCICLEVLKNPVTLACGHDGCLECLASLPPLAQGDGGDEAGLDVVGGDDDSGEYDQLMQTLLGSVAFEPGHEGTNVERWHSFAFLPQTASGGWLAFVGLICRSLLEWEFEVAREVLLRRHREQFCWFCVWLAIAWCAASDPASWWVGQLTFCVGVCSLYPLVSHLPDLRRQGFWFALRSWVATGLLINAHNWSQCRPDHEPDLVRQATAHVFDMCSVVWMMGLQTIIEWSLTFLLGVKGLDPVLVRLELWVSAQWIRCTRGRSSSSGDYRRVSRAYYLVWQQLQGQVAANRYDWRNMLWMPSRVLCAREAQQNAATYLLLDVLSVGYAVCYSYSTWLGPLPVLGTVASTQCLVYRL